METDSIKLEIEKYELVEESADEAFASISLNPTFRWCKFILTDDKPNLNKKRIPLEEFDNLVRTGINAPIKMEVSEIGDHAKAVPLGVITALKRENNYIKGLAALWSEERPEDVAMIKDCYDKGQPLNLSWEVMYSDKAEEDDGVIALKNTALRATTFVKLPAYAGRTPVLEVSSQESDTNTEESNLEELEQLQSRLDEMQTQMNEKEDEIVRLNSELDTVKAEKEELAQFKAGVEKERADTQRIVEIKTKFSEAGLQRPESYFTDNKEKLLAMEESELDFMIQDFVSFAPKKEGNETSSIDIPNTNSTNTSHSAKELGKKLREAK